MAHIYLDTNLWNISCDQELDPQVLLRRLDQEGSTLVLSLNAIDELSRTFLRPDSWQRAKKLFLHLDEYLKSGLRCFTKENPELLKAEMWAFQGVANSQKFLASEDVAKIGDLVSKYASGDLPEGCLDGLTVQTRLAQHERLKTASNLLVQSALASELAAIEESDFPIWAEQQLQSATAIRLMGEKLSALFPAVTAIELYEWSNALIKNRSRIATAMLKADFYYNWRCARRGSNRKDLLDDLSHVINASYCDVYATEETNQSQYARLILDSTAGGPYMK